MARAYATSRTKVIQCRVCGKDMTVNYYVRTAKRCFECGLNESITTMLSIARKSGPGYDRWRAGMRNWAVREGWGTDPTVRTVELPPEN